MTTSDERFQDLMTRVLAGSEEAAQELFLHYEPIVLAAIRRKLHKKLRSKFDSLDFTQDVWASFFHELPEKRAFESSEAMIAFLTQLAKNKVIDAVRQRMMAKKFNTNRERSLDGSMEFVKAELLAGDASPSLVISSEDEWNAFLRKQPKIYRHIFILIREGKTHAEIALELGINERTIRRVAEKIHARATP